MMRAILNRFRRIPQGDGIAAADWKRGDLAGCIATGPWFIMDSGRENHGPRFGDIMRVAAVRFDHGWHMLKFEGWPDDWYTACQFRKIVPRQHEACSEGFARWMRRKIRERVDA